MLIGISLAKGCNRFWLHQVMGECFQIGLFDQGLVGADRTALVACGRTTEAVFPHPGNPRPTTPACHHSRKQRSWPAPVPDWRVGVLGLQGSLTRTNLLPQIVLDVLQMRDFCLDEKIRRVQTRDTFAWVNNQSFSTELAQGRSRFHQSGRSLCCSAFAKAVTRARRSNRRMPASKPTLSILYQGANTRSSRSHIAK